MQQQEPLKDKTDLLEVEQADAEALKEMKQNVYKKANAYNT